MSAGRRTSAGDGQQWVESRWMVFLNPRQREVIKVDDRVNGTHAAVDHE